MSEEHIASKLLVPKDVEELFARNKFLWSNVPHCVACGHEQVQLTSANKAGAQWKCRICKFEFGYEPKAKR